MDSRSRKLIEAGLGASDYRTFLAKVFEASVKEGQKFNFAAFSRKAGFTSRGFIKEVLDGRKRLTSLSFPKVVKALQIPALLRHYFTYLVLIEEPELNIDRLTNDQIKSKLQEIKDKLALQLRRSDDEAPIAKALFKSYQVLEVYSALATKDPGTQLKEVMSRTGYGADVCLEVLKYLVTQDVVTETSGRFKALNPHAVYSSVGSDGIKTVYLDSLSALKRKATVRFNGKDQLYSQSFFSVQKHRMPELRKRLREVLHEFVETYETDDGDCIGKLIVGLYS